MRPKSRTSSPSSRRAWIEIEAARKRCTRRHVALLAEGVDRNRCVSGRPLMYCVALLAEGVDRNIMGLAVVRTDQTSPSSRRAWIEITSASKTILASVVALLAEGVDRNRLRPLLLFCRCWSPSSRRAWIEILLRIACSPMFARSPSSRRAWIEISWPMEPKSGQTKSPSSRRAWIEIAVVPLVWMT